MRVCLVYDCLYPHTIGGAERWYRNLAERLVREGHTVTYLTLRQWDDAPEAASAGVEVVAAGPRMELYEGGRRRVVPPLVFGAGVLWHLLLHGHRYDVVHTASFPFFSVLAAAATRPLHRFRLVVDWVEVWTREYWREYAGPAVGPLGWRTQRLCARIGHRAFCFSRLHAERLRGEGFRGQLGVLEGLYAGPLDPLEPAEAEPVVVFAGRHIPEKRVAALVPAFARARERVPELRCEIYGDGPSRPEVLRLIDALGLRDAVSAPGFVAGDRVAQAIRRALCVVVPSRREGYGLVVVEASALGTPSVVVCGPDNAATELVSEGENGFVTRSSHPDDLAAAILRVYDAGPPLRAATARWFHRNAQRLSLETSLQSVQSAYSAS